MSKRFNKQFKYNSSFDEVLGRLYVEPKLYNGRRCKIIEEGEGPFKIVEFEDGIQGWVDKSELSDKYETENCKNPCQNV